MTPAEAKLFYYGLREASFARQERLIEKLAVMLIKKPKDEWAPKEYTHAALTLCMMYQTVINNRGWNLSKPSRPDPLLSGETPADLFRSLDPDEEKSPAWHRLMRALDRRLSDAASDMSRNEP
jgi:arylamine N-acetyltransferase